MSIVLSLCDYTTNMVKPWLDIGHECWCVDMQHKPGTRREGNLVLVGADIRSWIPPRREYAIAFAFPPCTHLASSGARWFRDKGLSALAEAILLVDRAREICEWTGAPWMLENPVGTLSTYWRKPDYTFDPCDYGDPWTKKTCLWTGGGFVMPPKNRVEPLMGSMMHKMPPSSDRANKRSATPCGFAISVFEVNRVQVPVVEGEVQ